MDSVYFHWFLREPFHYFCRELLIVKWFVDSSEKVETFLLDCLWTDFCEAVETDLSIKCCNSFYRFEKVCIEEVVVKIVDIFI